jgi:2-polyprenyl-3-methyl-5-hydroxy-6-metoxy-1,4-benzoquinol methylase
VTYPERIIPDETPSGILALHLKRYEFARPFAAGRDVLDAACGAGYGSAYVGEVAANVLGVDVDEPTVEYARRRYATATVSFLAGDVTALDLADASFDVVVSFETIEHVRDGVAAVSEAARVLRPDGVYVVSTPQAAHTTTSPDNPFHQIEYSAEDFRALLASSFGSVELFGQTRVDTAAHRFLRSLDVLGLRRRIPLGWTSRVTGSRATPSLTLDDVSIGSDLAGATEILAVCRAPRT